MITGIIFFVSAAGVILLLIDVLLIIWCFKLKKRLDSLLKGGEKNLEESINNQIKQLESQNKEIKGLLEQTSHLNKIAKISFQKTAVIRYNPFNEAGGDQSFCIALLDSQNNGFVISSLYGRQMNRVYAKPIKSGTSEYALSNEEKQAIAKAMAS